MISRRRHACDRRPKRVTASGCGAVRQAAQKLIVGERPTQSMELDSIQPGTQGYGGQVKQDRHSWVTRSHSSTVTNELQKLDTWDENIYKALGRVMPPERRCLCHRTCGNGMPAASACRSVSSNRIAPASHSPICGWAKRTSR